jgi:cell division protein ZapA (FtsZ GTPase activity inhibitor)
MNIKYAVAALHAQNEQLREITTNLNVDLSKLRQAISESEGAADTDELSLLVGLAELNSSLLAATTVFYRQLQRFLMKTKSDNGTTLL